MIELPAKLLHARVVAILRGTPAERAIEIADRVWDTGLGIVEVPLQDRASAAVLELLVKRGRARGELVGAGTITTVARLEEALALGAEFTVAPGTHPAVIAASHAQRVPHVPGVATASDIQTAIDLGCHYLKAFPAVLLGPTWFRQMAGPFPDVTFVATGGVTGDNAATFFDAGVRAVGIGTAIADPTELEQVLKAATPPVE